MRVSHRAMAVAGDVGSESREPSAELWHLLQVRRRRGLRGGSGEPGAGGCSLRLVGSMNGQAAAWLPPVSTQLSLLCASVSSTGFGKGSVWWPMKDNPGTTTASTAKMLRESGQQALCFPSEQCVPRLCQKAVK